MKSISTINPAITENTDGTIVKVHAPVIDIKVGVYITTYKSGCVYHYALFCFQAFECLATIPSKD